MGSSAPQLFISLSGIARLAQVQRPVVSVWRSRAAASEFPFPAAVADDRGSDVFDAREVAEWLVTTGRGNNPQVLADASAYARFDATGRGDDDAFHALTALVAVRAAADRSIGVLSRAQLCDLAGEVDPDDLCVVSEVVGLGDELVALARFVDVVVDGAYGVSDAFESLLGERFRDGRRALTRTVLVPAVSELVSQLAVELASSNPSADAEHPVFVDPSGAGGDLLIAVLGSLAEGVEASVVLANSGGVGARLMRRRLMAHELPVTRLAVTSSGEFTASGAVVHVAQFPTAESPSMSSAQMLSAIENIVLQMDDAQRAVILAPASVLADGRLPREADALRSQILRSGRLRAVVRLPRGLVVSNPRQALALWVLGAAHDSVAGADRRTLVADLGDEVLSASVCTDLVSDVSAGLRAHVVGVAHAFRFTRSLTTAVLVARSGSLVASSRAVVTVPQAAVGSDFPARLDSIIAELGEATPEVFRAVTVCASPQLLPAALLGSLADSRHVRCLSGARLADAHVGPGGGHRVIGVAELLGSVSVGDRMIGRLLLAGAYPAARFTEPGDVVFCAGKNPAALVDADGFSVVQFPARILRINGSDAAGLVSELLASDIGRQSSGEWRRWLVRRVVPAQRAGVAAGLASVAAERLRLANRVRVLAELENVFVGGVVAGSLSTVGDGANVVALSKGFH